MNTEYIRAALQNKKVLAGVSAVLGFAAGATVGVVFATKRLEQKYADRATQEIEDAREYLTRLNKQGEFSTPESAAAVLIPVDEAATALETYQTGIVSKKEFLDSSEEDIPRSDGRQSMVEVAVNVFTNAENVEEFDYETELLHRDPSLPYLITFDEYLENHTENEQKQLTFYADNVLADEEDVLVAAHEGGDDIDDVDVLVGRKNLARFGVGSNDPNIVFVRNALIGMDYEISRAGGTYKTLVMGIVDEDETSLQHSAEPFPRSRRFPNQDY